MKHIRDGLITTLLLFILSGCKKDFLDVPNNTTVLRQEYVKDLSSLHDYLRGVYVEMAATLYSGGTLALPEQAGDNMKPNGWSSPFHEWSQFASDERLIRMSEAEYNCNAIWFTGYRIIRDCNFVIENVEQYRNEDPGRADQMKGEALGIRALAHFLLVNCFAQNYTFTENASHPGIPYITFSDWRPSVSRNTVKEVYDGIARDLIDATASLSANERSSLIFNKNAAFALLARVELFRGNLEESVRYARQVTQAVPLLPASEYPQKLFTREETEALFQLVPSALNGQLTFFVGQFFSFSSLVATQDIVELLTYSSTDSRKDWVKQNGSEWDIVKFPKNVEPGFGNPARAYYQTLLRSSEMYLTLAEAYAYRNQPDSAIFFLDAIRKRADQNALPTNTSGATLIAAIKTERRKELAFEGLRMFDIQRWHEDVIRKDAPAAVKVLAYPSHKAISPLPLPDVQAGIQQNISY